MENAAQIFSRFFALISPFWVGIIIVAAWGGLFVFFQKSNRLQRRAVFLAWLVPGLGHAIIGKGRRGAFGAILVFLTFLVGMALADFRNISPFERHPIWGIAHFFGGLMSLIPAIATLGWKIEADLATYGTGCLYSAVACLLNILLVLDVWDLSATPAGEKAAKNESAEPSVTSAGTGGGAGS